MTNGNITITETVGDLRVGTIQSNAGDVTLATDAGSIVDTATGTADNGATAWVLGNVIKLTAAGGSAVLSAGIGTATDPLEIDSSYPPPAQDADPTGKVFALAGDSVALKEVAGDLRLDGVASKQGNVLVAVVNGDLIDADNDPQADVQGALST